MSATHLTQLVHASRSQVYHAIIDERSVQSWMVPDGMRSHVHEFDGREGGAFRISLTYDSPDSVGKSSEHTDTYHGHFVKLVPDTTVVQAMEFETDDPKMQGEMRVTFELTDVEGGTMVSARHDAVPPGVSEADNETGWKMSLRKLADLVEQSAAS